MERQFTGLWKVMVVLGALSAACQYEEVVAFEDYCGELHGTVCRRVERCGAESPVCDTGSEPFLESCQAMMKGFAARDTIRYNPEGTARCLADLNSAQCLSPEFEAGFAAGPSTCASSWDGILSVGEPCEERIDCQTQNCIEGICAPRRGVGEACLNSPKPIVCQDGLKCVDDLCTAP